MPPSKFKVLSPTVDQLRDVDLFNLLLTRSLDVTTTKYGEYEIDYRFFDVYQNRSMRMLQSGELDIMYVMTNKEREAQYLAVKFPLVKGLLGHRLIVVNRENLSQYQGISKEQLSQKVACQGTHWPDTQILEANQFNVVKVLNLESMYKMLDKGRCDYFPRSVLEVNSELERFAKVHPRLAIVKDVMLVYPAPVYFFVKKSNQALAKRLLDGLTILSDSGEMEKLLVSQPLTKHVFPLSQWQEVKQIHLFNPNLESSTKSILPTHW